jgi:hypothetical protein
LADEEQNSALDIPSDTEKAYLRGIDYPRIPEGSER